jgi:hypothetical protein
LAPRRSWTSAGWTTTLSRSPSVSTTRGRWRPRTFVAPAFVAPANPRGPPCCVFTDGQLDARRAGRQVASDTATGELPPGRVERFPHTVVAPAADGVGDGGPWAIVTGQRAPGTATPHQVHQAVEHAAKRH